MRLPTFSFLKGKRTLLKSLFLGIKKTRKLSYSNFKVFGPTYCLAARSLQKEIKNLQKNRKDR
ncbi:hypothetical protein AGMMS49592_0210 [Endomicrobiia bacterium]|nr:hypothetical protein AGMMS49592_0210 [Endomicrobiia bacterium]